MKKIFLLIMLAVTLLPVGAYRNTPVLDAADAPAPPVGAQRAAPLPEPSLAELEARYAAAQAQLREELANLRAAQAEIGRIREIGPRIEAEAQALKAQIDALKKSSETKNPAPAAPPARGKSGG